jgi:cell division protein FtsB
VSGLFEARIAKVENRVDALEKRIEKLEKWVGTLDMLAQQCKNRLDKLER